MSYRIPLTSKYVQMATQGRATGVWDRWENTFNFQQPPGITKGCMEFSGIPGYYQFDFDTAQCSGSYVNWGDYDYDYESDWFQHEREFSRWGQSRPTITNHPFWRLNSRLENYNPARPWTVPEPRHCHSPPLRACSTSQNATRQTPHHSKSVSFVRNTPNRNVRSNTSPTRRVNVNIVTPGCMMTRSILHPRTPTPQRPTSPPLYTPPYHPDPSPSPSFARPNTLSCQTTSPIPDEIASGGLVTVNTGHKTPETEILTRQSLQNPKGEKKTAWARQSVGHKLRVSCPEKLWIFAMTLQTIYRPMTSWLILQWNVTFQIVGWIGQNKTTPRIQRWS